MEFVLRNGLPGGFAYAASTVVSYRAEFKTDAEGVVNGRIDLPDPEAAYRDYEYISAVWGEPVRLPATITVECAFEAFGAPLVVFSERLEESEDGWKTYGEHYEAVLYEGGINMWHIVPKPEGGQQVAAIEKAKHEFSAGDWHTMTVRLTREGIEARCGTFEARGKVRLPEKMYVGFTACEGINRFRRFAIESI